MHVRGLFCRAALAAAVLGGIAFAGTATAGASPVDPADFTCGTTPQPCNESAHYSTPNPDGTPQLGAPSPEATTCAPFVRTDAPLVTGTGNGIEHAVVNNNGQGFWFTSTFTGDVTVQFAIVDSEGNFVKIDPAAPVLTGHITETSGISGNLRNFVMHDTVNFAGSDGTNFNAVDHTNTNAVPPPNTTVNDFHIASCT
jgi:hypothetical protein